MVKAFPDTVVSVQHHSQDASQVEAENLKVTHCNISTVLLLLFAHMFKQSNALVKECQILSHDRVATFCLCLLCSKMSSLTFSRTVSE